jgi:hypothetical protein
MFKLIFISFIGFFLFKACSSLSPESSDFNVYFRFSADSKDYFLGVTYGLEECRSLAFNFANSKKMSRNDDWSYICCMKTASSECQEKHL